MNWIERTGGDWALDSASLFSAWGRFPLALPSPLPFNARPFDAPFVVATPSGLSSSDSSEDSIRGAISCRGVINYMMGEREGGVVESRGWV